MRPTYVRSTLWALIYVTSALLYCATVNAQTATYTRSDITGNDIDCGQSGGKCRVCGDINAIDSSCRTNPQCTAYTFDNSCGFLKSRGEPRTYREGYSAFVVTEKTSGSSSTPSSAATGGVPSPSPSSSQLSSASPADTVQVSANSPNPGPAAGPPAPQNPSNQQQQSNQKPSPPGPSPSPQPGPSPSPQLGLSPSLQPGPSMPPPSPPASPSPAADTTSPDQTIQVSAPPSYGSYGLGNGRLVNMLTGGFWSGGRRKLMIEKRGLPPQH